MNVNLHVLNRYKPGKFYFVSAYYIYATFFSEVP